MTTYTTYGTIRGGCGHRHRTEEAAKRCLDADQLDCERAGGYSDRKIAVVGDDGRLYHDDEAREAFVPPGATRAVRFRALAGAALALALALPAGAQASDVPQECTADVLGQGGGCVNVNTATAEQLSTLYRIGPALAARIIEEREAGGPYSAMYQLAERVKGLGPLTTCYNQRAIVLAGETTRTEKLRPEPELIDACRRAESPGDFCIDC